ncbi:hypothetical protein Goarm_003270 [Gossypium armourianum]|uniref:Uncharacterized protein n=1 Tax=Gossypium armourianum TaxID=34283 RepID=A0A7J9K346_9ROSI|nr:hypothetical protein [Gossypium armourianum]
METRGRSRKNSRSMDILLTLEGLVVNLEESICEALNFFKGDQSKKNDALKAMGIILKEHVVELKGKLTIYKVALGNEMLALGPRQHRMNVPKLKEFEGMRSARDLDNFSRDGTIISCDGHHR